jgi:hypothetical protein
VTLSVSLKHTHPLTFLLVPAMPSHDQTRTHAHTHVNMVADATPQRPLCSNVATPFRNHERMHKHTHIQTRASACARARRGSAGW